MMTMLAKIDQMKWEAVQGPWSILFALAALVVAGAVIILLVWRANRRKGPPPLPRP